jgi:hypothetical protein
MGHIYNSQGVTPSTGGGGRIPPGRYLLEITSFEEKQSNNGDYQVVVDCIVIEPKVMNEVPVFNATIKWHRVTFLPRSKPGAGIAIHWLKSIGEPWMESDQLDIEPLRWVGRKFWANVTLESYEKSDGQAGQKNVIKEVLGLVEPVFKEGDSVRAAMELQTPMDQSFRDQPKVAAGGLPDGDDIPF